MEVHGGRQRPNSGLRACARAAGDGVLRIYDGFGALLGVLAGFNVLQSKFVLICFVFAGGFLGADSTTGKLSCGPAFAAESMLAGGLTGAAIGGADAARVRSLWFACGAVPAGI